MSLLSLLFWIFQTVLVTTDWLRVVVSVQANLQYLETGQCDAVTEHGLIPYIQRGVYAPQLHRFFELCVLSNTQYFQVSFPSSASCAFTQGTAHQVSK